MEPCVLRRVFALCVFLGLSRQISRAETVALVGAKIYVDPDRTPISNGVVLVDGALITAVGPQDQTKIPERTRIIDCAGATISAGFWNSHLHFFQTKWANAATIPASELGRQLEDMIRRYGFTSVFDLGSRWENTRLIRDRVESGEAPGPRIRSTGEGLLPRNAGIPPEAALNMLGVMKP